MPARASLPLYFPVGVPQAIRHCARSEGLNPDFTALVCFQLQRRIAPRLKGLEGRWKHADLSFPMYSHILKECCNHYQKHMNALVKHKVLVLREEYVKALKRSRLYSYSSKFNPVGPCEPFLVYKKAVVNKLLSRGLSKQVVEDPFLMGRLQDLERFELDADAASAWLRSQATARKGYAWGLRMELLVARVGMGYRRISRDMFGREHHTLLQLPKSIRQQHLSHQGEPLVELDIPSCHPALLYGILKRRKMFDADLGRFLLALSDDFYDYLGSLQHLHFGKKPSRDKVKRAVMYQLFGQQDPTSKIHQVFSDAFPVISKGLDLLKENNKHQFVSHMLQEKESSLVRSVCLELDEKRIGPYFTVFDGIAGPASMIEDIEKIFLRHLHHHGLVWIQSLRKLSLYPRDNTTNR